MGCQRQGRGGQAGIDPTFIDWLATPEEAVAFAELRVRRRSSVRLPRICSRRSPVGELLESGAFTGLPNAAWPNAGVYDALGTGVQGLLTGQKTVEQVLDDMDAAWG